jgi:hypothetical protein
MDTQDLIRGLSSDARLSAPRLPALLAGAHAAAGLAAAVVFLVLLGPRDDIAAAAAIPRFLFKFVLTIALAAGAGAACLAAVRPGASLRPAIVGLAAAPVLALAAVAVEFAAIPPAGWGTRWIGTNIAVCLTFIPLIGLLPLAILLWALRQGAPPRPRLAGALAGLAAGGIAATFYAAHCTDDSPFFVATWYTIAVAVLALVGALVGGRLLRW